MNRIAKLPTFGNSISIFYQTQLTSIIIGGEKTEIGINIWSKSVKYLVKNNFQETSLIYPVSQHLGCQTIKIKFTCFPLLLKDK